MRTGPKEPARSERNQWSCWFLIAAGPEPPVPFRQRHSHSVSVSCPIAIGKGTKHNRKA